MAALHNLQAEQALLGAILFDNEALKRIPSLEPGHFFEPIHARIFGVCARLIGQGRLADGVTLREWFKEQGALQEIGGAKYLITLHDNAARMTSHAIEYAHVILDLAAKREIERVVREAVHTMASSEVSASAVASALETSLRSIAMGSSSGIALDEAWARVVEGLASPAPRGVRTGIGALDRRLGGLFSPDLVILAGRPAMGKTSLATNIAVNVARSFDDNGGRVAHFASMEMSAEQLATRVGSRYSTTDPAKAFAYSDVRIAERRPSVAQVAGIAPRLPRTLYIDETGAQTLAHLRTQARETRRRYGRLDLLVIDYLQLMTSLRKDGRVNEVSDITAGLKATAKDLQVPVVALSQLSRKVEERDDKRPHLADLRESGSIEQDADCVLFLYRDEYYLAGKDVKPREHESRSDFDQRLHKHHDELERSKGIAEIITGKSRHGPVGIDKVRMDPPFDAVSDLEPEASQKSHWQDRT